MTYPLSFKQVEDRPIGRRSKS